MRSELTNHGLIFGGEPQKKRRKKLLAAHMKLAVPNAAVLGNQGRALESQMAEDGIDVV